MNLDRVYSELDWFSKNKIEFIFCCDANFGMLPRDFEIALKAENKKIWLSSCFVSTEYKKCERAYKVQSYWPTQAVKITLCKVLI